MRRFAPLLFVLTIGCLGAGPASAQQLAGGEAPDISLLRVFAALIVCIGAAVGLAFVLRARGRPSLRAWPSLDRIRLGKAMRIDVIEARRLSPHADICLVRCGGSEYLLLCGIAGMQVLNKAPIASHELEQDGDAVA